MPTKLTTTTKKVIKAKPKAAEVVSVPTELAFWTIDGRVYRSLDELATGLKEMDGRVYRYHADKDYQDFARWVSEVFQKKVLAAALKKATTQKVAEKLIRDSLKLVKK